MLLHRKISIAPMVDRTDEHFRYLMRLLSKNVYLYTPMYSAKSIINNRAQILRQTKLENPTAIQIATDSPSDAYNAIKILESEYNFDEYNLNLGCPSKKISEANFGAALIKNPKLINKIIKKMLDASSKPISVKIRTGVRENFEEKNENTYEELKEFLETILPSGIKNITIHARVAILNKFSPKDNRNIPPLKWDFVHKIKKDFPELFIELNGGIKKLEDIEENLKKVDSIMIGREAYSNPYFIAKASRLFLSEDGEIPSLRYLLKKLIEYITYYEEHLRVSNVFKHIMNIVHGKRGARNFRINLSPPYPKNLKPSEILIKAMEELPKETLEMNS